MVWFKVDDSFYDHPKVMDLSDSAVALWARAGSYCAKHLTDGLVTARQVRRLCDNPERAAAELVTAGLWREDGDGYRFHDWREYQPTREEALAASRAKSIGGAVGNHRRWHLERGKPDPDCVYCIGPDRLSDRLSDRSTDRATESLPIPPTRPDPTRENQQPPSGVVDAPAALPADQNRAAKPRRSATKGTRIPDDFGITREMRGWAAEEIAGFDIDREFRRFRDYWRSQPGQKGVKTDWVATWRNWMRRAYEERSPPAGGGAVVPITDRNRQPRQPSTADSRIADAAVLAQHFAERDRS